VIVIGIGRGDKYSGLLTVVTNRLGGSKHHFLGKHIENLLHRRVVLAAFLTLVFTGCVTLGRGKCGGLEKNVSATFDTPLDLTFFDPKNGGFRGAPRSPLWGARKPLDRVEGSITPPNASQESLGGGHRAISANGAPARGGWGNAATAAAIATDGDGGGRWAEGE